MAEHTPFSALVEVLKPGATGKDLVELLDGKAERTAALHWKAGRFGPPAWAIDLLRDKLARRQECERAIAAKVEAGPGRKAGTRNIMAYNAKR